MRVWVIGRGYPTAANRMWGSFELEQAKMLARNGCEVSYISLTLSFLNRKDPRGLRSFEEDGVRIYAYSRLYFPGKAGIYWESFEDRCWRSVLEKAESDTGLPDIIHVHYPSMISSINEIDKYRSRGVKIFVTEHWSRVLINTLKGHERRRLQYYAQNADCFACVSEALQNAVKKLAAVTVPMEVIPNIVSPMFFEAAENTKKAEDGFTFITVGRLVPLKQFDVVIRQFLKEFDGNEKVKLRVVGSGTDRKKLKDIANGSTQITFTGELSLEDTCKEVAEADALVSFSKYETFAAPVAEAWACGKPVIVSAESGISSYVNRQNGLVIKRKSHDKLSSALRYLYDHHKDYKPEDISHYAAVHFSDSAVMKKIRKMYTCS